MKNIASAFVKAQKQFAPALKTNTNPHFKSKYVGLDGCVEAVIDALNDNGIALMQVTHPDETGVTVETMFIHESGETLSGGKLHVPASKNDPQGYGSALTYCRRYSLMAACGHAPEDDDGNAASKNPSPQPLPQVKKKPTTPEDFAKHASNEIKAGQTAKIAVFLAGMPEDEYKAVWKLLSVSDQDKLIAAWPQ